VALDHPREAAARPYGRRVFLATTAVGLTSLLWAQPVWRRVSPAANVLPGWLRDVFPADGWRIYTVAPTMPVFRPETWRLQIYGQVEHPVTLSYDELRALPRARQVSDFHCVTGWTVRNVQWTGARIDDLLAKAKPLPGAKALWFISAEEPYVDSLTLDQARLPDAMLAYEMNGAPLSRAHGAPARFVIPDMYGYKGTKWVSKIVVSDAPIDGYWEQRGYDRDAWVGHSNGYGVA
jgi:DMSO/TMAO reductase YedYZ molybdopterin-dependent catalytic subunit